jgi:hypothetical protein
MNITDNFFILGQGNWDFIGTIINSILVGALVYINWKYLKKLNEQTELKEKDRERNKILEGIRYFLIPSIDMIEKEIDKITNGTRIEHFVQKFNVMKGYYSYAFEDIIEKFTDLREKFHANDELAEKLNTFYSKYEKEVTNEFNNNKFNESLTNIINNYNRLNSDALIKENLFHSDLKNICKVYIINQWDLSNNIPEASVSQINFLKENKDELQRYRDLPNIKELHKKIKETSNALKKSDKDILKRFKEIIKEYRKEYHYTEDEIKPKYRG